MIVDLGVAHQSLLNDEVAVGGELADEVARGLVAGVVADDDAGVFDLVSQREAEQHDEHKGEHEEDHERADVAEHVQEFFPDEDEELGHV